MEELKPCSLEVARKWVEQEIHDYCTDGTLIGPEIEAVAALTCIRDELDHRAAPENKGGKDMDAESKRIFDALYDLQEHDDENPKLMICADAADHIRKLSEELERLKAAPENKPQWISIAERLPNPIPSRLLVTDGKIVCETSGEVLAFCHENFTHWMALPKPPEEQSYLCKVDGEIRSEKDGFAEPHCDDGDGAGIYCKGCPNARKPESKGEESTCKSDSVT